MIISKTPYRISFFGGGTDYPAYCDVYGGQVLSSAIDKYCYISVRELPPFFPHKHRLVYSKIESVRDIKEISHPVVREMLVDLNAGKDGLEIHHDGDLPARSGLGTSSSFTVGLYNAISARAGISRSSKELADYAINLEQNILNESVGYQDQIAAAFGGFNHIIFHEGGGYEVSPVKISRARLKELESKLMLFFTGVTRFASSVAEQQIKATEVNKEKLQQMGQMVETGLNILKNEDLAIEKFGVLLDEGWSYKRSLTDKITSNNLDEIYDRAKDAGAIGGKLLGAGGGGFFLFFAHLQQQDEIRNALKELVHVPFKFADAGSSIILGASGL